MIVYTQFENKPLLFEHPTRVISTCDPSSLEQCFGEMEDCLSKGFYLAGFLSYEAGYAFEHRLRQERISDFPLICMGVFPPPRSFRLPHSSCSRGHVYDTRLNISPERYYSHIETIRQLIAQGQVYQVTYCLKMLGGLHGSALGLFGQLLKEQPVPYPAFIEADSYQVLSCSPEMFVAKKGEHIVTNPMKGTWNRGRGVLADWRARLKFRSDRKNRAENVMIADLLRNDLGRIGRQVRARRLFTITGYKTVYQMTSTITAEVHRDMRLYRLLSALFPSGSVTGAPKIRAMQIIRELEGEPRRIYTGAIGYVTPKRDLFFNVPIRTLLVRKNQWEMGIGGGIIWDSTPQGEWAEGLLKAQFVTASRACLGGLSR